MTHITTRDNTRLYVKDWGTGRPVVLIHGWPLSADTWDDTAIALADAGFRAIAYNGDLWIYQQALAEGVATMRQLAKEASAT